MIKLIQNSLPCHYPCQECFTPTGDHQAILERPRDATTDASGAAQNRRKILKVYAGGTVCTDMSSMGSLVILGA